jgi:hypothetical protein
MPIIVDQYCQLSSMSCGDFPAGIKAGLTPEKAFPLAVASILASTVAPVAALVRHR